MDGALVRVFALVEPSGRSSLRVGYAVSSRTYGAVRRNRIRRLMREAFRGEREPLLESLRAGGSSVELIFSLRKIPPAEAARLKLHPVRSDIAQICRQLRARVQG
jgi:hypothetical protein